MSPAIDQSESAPTIVTPEYPSAFRVLRSCSYQEML